MLDLERDVLSITGAQNLESARGIMQANKASATELLTVKAKLETLESERRSERVTNLIEKGRADRKLTPALEAWAKTQTPEALEAFLSAAPTITALAAPENLEPGEGKGGAQITHNGKTWDQLEPADKHNLYIENKALYDQMRAAARQN
jgi:phage I-like protein